MGFSPYFVLGTRLYVRNSRKIMRCERWGKLVVDFPFYLACFSQLSENLLALACPSLLTRRRHSGTLLCILTETTLALRPGKRLSMLHLYQ